MQDYLSTGVVCRGCTYIYICMCVRVHVVCVCYSYHTGSLAFGSLILAVVQMFRIVLEYLDHKLKGMLYECISKCQIWVELQDKE